MHLILDGSGSLQSQVIRALKLAIASGALGRAPRLPPTRVLARELQLSRNTVIAAYEQLRAEGLVDAKVGRGSFIVQSFDPLPAIQSGPPTVEPQSEFCRRARQLHTPSERRPGVPRVRFSFQYGVPYVNPALTSAWSKEIGRAAQYTPLNYPDPQGLLSLREAVSEYLARKRGVHVSADDVLIVHGTQQAVSLTAQVLLEAGDHVAIEEPQYAAIRKVLQIYGAQLQPIPVDANGMQVDLLPAGAPKLICVTPSHQFPSGSVLSAERRDALLAYASRHNCWVFEDDYDGEFRYDHKPLPALRSKDSAARVIYAGTFSKLLFPSLRLGYIVMPRALRNDFRTAKWAQDMGTGAIEQAALARFMAEGSFDRHLRAASNEMCERRTALLEGLYAVARNHNVEISDSHAGMHLVAWLNGIPRDAGETLLENAFRVGLGLHSVDRHFLTPPKRFGLLFGFCGISASQIRESLPLLSHCLDEAYRGQSDTPAMK